MSDWRGMWGPALLVVLAALAVRQAPVEHWIGSWYAAPTARVDQPASPTGASGQSLLHFHDQTLRQIAHLTLGGSRLRVVVGNTFGTADLRVGAASVALRDRETSIVASSARPLSFGGATAVTVAAGALATSDPVDLAAPDFADLAIDLYLPGDTSAMRSPITT